MDATQDELKISKSLLTPSEVYEKIINNHDAFIFDMDGVLRKTDKPIIGAREALDTLIKLNKKIFFATNNSMSRSKDYAAKIRRLGLGIFDPQQIYCASNAVALYLRSINFKGKVYLIGPKSLREELRLLDDVQIVEHTSSKQIMPHEMAKSDIDTSITAVIMGFDPLFCYYKLAYASAILNGNPNCLFIATNKDKKFPTQRWILPGTGSFVNALESSTEREAIIAGKPNSVIIDKILEENPELQKDRICMIGDNLLTDIHFGKLNGLNTVLTETGVHNREDTKKAIYKNLCPDYIITSIKEIACLDNL